MSDKSRPGNISGQELMAQLAEDEQYQAKAAAIEAEMQARREELERAAQPIIDDLQAIGFDVKSVWDLGNSGNSYASAIPILLKHLQKGGYPDAIMESLATLLAVRESVSIWSSLRQLYLAASGPREEEALASSLAAAATGEQLDDLVTLLHEPTRGSSRIHFLRPIKRVGGRRGIDILKSLQEDSMFGKEVRALLKGRTAP